MKTLTNILIALAVIVVIAGVIVYFLPNNYTVTNSVEINKPADVVYKQIADFNNWHSWSPWAEMEPNAKITVDGVPASVGHKMSWNGEKLGEGCMTLSGFVPNQSLKCDDEFVKPMKATSKDNWKIESNGNKTTVTWTTTGGLKFPMGRLFGLAIDKMVSQPEKHGLENLKKVCEAMPEAPVASVDSSSANKM